MCIDFLNKAELKYEVSKSPQSGKKYNKSHE